MTTKKTFFTLLLAAIICAPASLSAQITIGSGAEPSQWSLLDLDNQARIGLQERPKALHLPRMSTGARDSLFLIPNLPTNFQDSARGLMIFNTTLHCLEFWSGTEWVSLCEGNEPPIRCGAYIAPGVWRRFMCHNLGADKNLCPFTPYKGLHGAMFQFGVNTPVLTAAENISELGPIANWPARHYNLDHWTNTPCPPGWRIPTVDEWHGVRLNNPRQNRGSWDNSVNNFTAGTFYGDYLFLPAAGGRFGHRLDSSNAGAVNVRGVQGIYWSSSPFRVGGPTAIFFWFLEGLTNHHTLHLNMCEGFPIRCIEE